jgi:hypothetical protein
MFNTHINVLTDDLWTYKWMNVIQILHLPINLCVKCVFNAQYQRMKCTNYEWTNFAWFSLLSHKKLSYDDNTIVMLNKSIGGGRTWKEKHAHEKKKT